MRDPQGAYHSMTPIGYRMYPQVVPVKTCHDERAIPALNYHRAAGPALFPFWAQLRSSTPNTNLLPVL